MTTTAADVKKLRDETGAGFLNCKKALVESKGNFNKAKEWLKRKDLSRAFGKVHRMAKEGVVASYIHGQGKVGVLVEVNSETDFAAKKYCISEICEKLKSSYSRYESHLVGRVQFTRGN